MRRKHNMGLEATCLWALNENSVWQAGCLIWQGDAKTARSKRGYAIPQIKFRGKMVPVSHLVLSWLDGPKQDGYEACHDRECSTSLCIAPWHLRWDTHDNNMKDLASQGLG